jgi:hypothetical protein
VIDRSEVLEDADSEVALALANDCQADRIRLKSVRMARPSRNFAPISDAAA